MRLGPTGHVDGFARANLPPADEWPDLLLDGFDYPEWLNAGVELCDAHVAAGHGERIALIGNGRTRTYRELAEWSNRIARALVEELSRTCPEFATMWSANDVSSYGEGTKHVDHPIAGRLALEYSAFAVDDRFHGKGLGTVLLERLAAAAAAHGLRRFDAMTLPENAAMLDVFHESGFEIRSKSDYGAINVQLSLGATREAVARSDGELLITKPVVSPARSRSGK